MAVGPTIYTAVVGCGVATQIFHVPLLLAQKQLFTLKTIVEKAGSKPIDTINKIHRTQIKWASDLQDVIQDEDIELVSPLAPNRALNMPLTMVYAGRMLQVVIATPNHMHFEMAKVCCR